MAPRQPLLHDLAVTLRAPTVCLSAPDGQLRGSGTQGVLCADVRVLARAVVTVDGCEPEPIGHGVTSASTEQFIGILRGVGVPGADPTVWLRRDRTVLADGLRETFTLVNRSDEAISVELRLDLDADLAPIETIKRGEPVPTAPPGVTVQISVPDADPVVVPGFPRVLRWPLTVPAGAEAARSWSLSVHDSGAVVTSANTRLARPHTVRADDLRLAALLDRAVADLDALLLTEPGHPRDVFAGAGAPWYLTLFGRDSLWTATLLLPYDVALAGGTLRTLARTQGRATDPETGEEPGKILHERRRAATPFAERLPPLYYGTIDATPLWICLLRDAWRWGLPAEEVRALLPNLEAALGWIGRHGDRFVAYHDPAGRGLPNQGWKDSADAVRFADGHQASGPIALVEVQGYVHAAALAGAELLDAFDRPGAVTWRAYAADLADRFRARFWVADADGPFPALALDGTGTGVDALTSNIGHVLGTGLLDDAESALVAVRIRDLANGYGVRTMAARAAGYSPLSYHCGSVWPHDTAIVARGLSRAGHPAAAADLARQLLVAADAFDGRLPELFAGFGAEEVAAPVAYPASCRPQAWSAAAAVELLRVVLGLTVDVPAGVVTLRPPTPSPVGALEVGGL
ncbi:MAG TPA: glycogen debranching N-terminal domain-containing protein, partial [Pseudonocardia sp.]|nr:glycogen debranching N-terminal domain-containing protein [Pseudonocardia sp.]